MDMHLVTKKHLEETMRLWQSTITELKRLEDFLSIERINDQFYRRLFIRCVFSIIETYLYVTKELIKIKLTIDSPQGIQLTWEELVILNEKKVFLDNQGKVKTKDEYQRFDSSLKFTLNTFSSMLGMGLPDYGDNKFQTLIMLATRRNDITHPKSLSQLLIKDQEMKDTVEVFRWFMETHGTINKKYIQWISELSGRK
ncbi:MAG: hypothetical protein A2W90_08340 [Bacteroidetes bacterium GWF2_42_66]|nr:MAG: hypothetical protein A2W92_15095 [Bacteroidetes bacterium GWA2_42_15]OFX96482.1 MAG: hypothetical protein A2W89_06000 [Bacteroidetes bacterium GWE2_42_39]OFY40902.1 MAG: hypothetical protein A2W90_08340 [Bacteroidetes bacterium GWF2_42_66]HBL76333.1 hypothetical protein [Prolixibacteraceae bacterium]HCR92113.1 hypothetical protein [Prolixibacteraceae bacterium]